MRRFRFDLRHVLRLRAQLERSQRRAVAAAAAEAAIAERRLENAQRGLDECQDRTRDGTRTAGLARALENGLVRLRWRLSAERRLAEAKLESARADWLVRQRELRPLERLRDRRQDEWRKQAAAAEQAELDELARLRRAAVAAAEVARTEEDRT